jgi:formylglycine-generating enzyme required for sulfatase activity
LANLSISVHGIDETIESLNYTPGSVKHRAILAIRAFYPSEESIKTLHSIDTDTLISSIWDLDDNLSKIRTKRRNFSSIKSSINADLEKLSKHGQNNENIIIADSNVFDMSEEAKNNLLSSFTDAVKTGDVNLEQAAGLLEAVTDFLDHFQADEANADSRNIVDQIKKILDKITAGGFPDEDGKAQEDGSGGQDGEIADAGDLDEEVEVIDDPEDELEEDEDFEEVPLEEDEELEVIDDPEDELEDLGADDDFEEVELDEDDEMEEIETPGEDEDLEEVDEIDEDEELDELDEDELKALEEFRQKKELAEHFDETLGERERKYNRYVTVPGGKYTVGTKKSITSSLELQEFEMPRVYIAAYPITNSLFEIFIEETGYVTTAEKTGSGRVYSSRYKKHVNGSTWNKNAGSQDVKGACWFRPSGPGATLHGKRNHPVVQVSVDDALAFASWIGRRLPTEAEWEAAARTDLGNRYPWGNEFNPEALNIEQSGLSDTSAVDAYDAFANEFNIADMLGNVMEWTMDSEPPPFKSKQNILYNVAKGAAWNAGKEVSISSRAVFKPGFTSNTIGFRCISEIFL